MIIEMSPPTMIAEGTRAHGTFFFYSSAQVFGIIEGEITQHSLEPIHVGRTGWINGSINSKGPVIIEGRVDGNIHSDTKVQLMSTATTKGIISSPSVIIRAGAMFDGSTRMISS